MLFATGYIRSFTPEHDETRPAGLIRVVSRLSVEFALTRDEATIHPFDQRRLSLPPDVVLDR